MQLIQNTYQSVTTNVLEVIKTEIVPKIYSDANNAFISNNTNGLTIIDNAPRLSKNTLICNDINNVGTCTCLFDTFDQMIVFYLIGLMVINWLDIQG